MKPLYFTACAHPKVAPALATQVHESLRPHAAYLKSALATALKRESRSACRWEPAPREHRLRLEPMDSLLIMETDGFGYRLDDWQGDAPDMPLFVGDEYRPMKPRRIERAAGGLLLVLDEEIAPPDRIFWEGKPCTLTPAKPSWPAKLTVRRSDGSVAHLLQRREEATRTVLVVQGRDPVVIEDEHGAKLPHRVTEPREGDSRQPHRLPPHVPQGAGRLVRAIVHGRVALSEQTCARVGVEECPRRRHRRHLAVRVRRRELP